MDIFWLLHYYPLPLPYLSVHKRIEVWHIAATNWFPMSLFHQSSNSKLQPNVLNIYVTGNLFTRNLFTQFLFWFQVNTKS